MPYKDLQKRKEHNHKYQLDYYIKNREKLRAYWKEYYKDNKEKVLKKNKDYFIKNPHKLKEISRRYFNSHHEKELLRGKKYRELNHDKVLEGVRNYRNSERGKLKIKEYHKLPYVKQKSKEYQLAHPDKVKLYQKKYCSSTKGKIRKYKRRLKIPNDNLNQILSSQQLTFIKERDKICVYCFSDKKLTYDHIVALNNNGDNSFYNFVIACEKCNKSKRDLEVIEWFQTKNYQIPQVIKSNLIIMNKINQGRTELLFK